MIRLEPRLSPYGTDAEAHTPDQVPHLTKDTNVKVTNSQSYTTKESQEVSPFLAGDHKAQSYQKTKILLF